MGLSVWQIAVVVILFLLLFGRGRIPQLMGDLAEGIKGFRKGLSDETSSATKDAADPADKPAA
jgi:sec-independent protein translocase protein TatA